MSLFDTVKNDLKNIARAFRTLPNWSTLTFEVAAGNPRGQMEGARGALGHASASSGCPDVPHYRIIPLGFTNTANAPTAGATIETMRDIIHGACTQCRKKDSKFSIGAKEAVDNDGRNYIALFPSRDGTTESPNLSITNDDLEKLMVEVFQQINDLKPILEQRNKPPTSGSAVDPSMVDKGHQSPSAQQHE